MKENNNKGIIIFLIIITIIMGIITILALNGTISLKQKQTENTEEITDNTQIYNYSDIKGLYTFVSEKIIEENNNEITPSYNLFLYENGMFQYQLSTIYPFGYIGNYIIKDNQIVLNYLFSTNSGASIDVTEGTHTITINDNNKLIDNNQPISNINLTKITLTKDENNTIKYENTFNKINNYEITNNSNKPQ